MKRPKFQFRQAQAAFDLIQLIQSLGDQTLAKIGGPDLISVARIHHCRFESEAHEDCYSNLAGIAIEGGDNCALAMAVLVANDLQRGLWAGSSVEIADFCLDYLKSAPNELRSAILRGLDAEIEFPFQVTYPQPDRILPNVSRLTCASEQILPKLRDIARSMDHRTKTAVSLCDYGADPEQHLEALEEVLTSQDCVFSKENYWYPSEVVELSAHNLSSPGFIECTALLLVNAVIAGGRVGWFTFRWERLSKQYNSLPERVREPILSGIRYLYETDPYFYYGPPYGTVDPTESPEKMIGAKVDLELLLPPG